MTVTYMPPNEPRCRPSKACSQAPRCVRFRAPYEPGRPVMDGCNGAHWTDGYCLNFRSLDYFKEPALEVKGPYDYMKGLL